MPEHTRTGRRKAELHEVLGEPFDRAPCPHSLRRREQVWSPGSGQFGNRDADPNRSWTRSCSGRPK